MRSRVDTGFTLIELLVVIAIIAILASILFPIFARTRESARQVACLSHLRQCGTAILLYVGDYDGCWPNCGGEWGGDAYYHTIGTHYFVEFLDPYVKNKRIYQCPSDRYAPVWSGGGVDYANRSLYEQCGSSFQFIPQKFKLSGASGPTRIWKGPVIPSPVDWDGYPSGGAGTKWSGRNAGSAKASAEFPLLADTLQWHFRVSPEPGETQPWLRYRRNVWFADGHASFVLEREFSRLRDEVVQYR